MSKSIAEYVAAAKKGDQSAFSELFQLTSQKAYYTAFKMIKNSHDAEDMVQDAFIKAFTSLDTLTDDSKFESWLNMIVANKCRDCLKKKRPDVFSKYENEESDIAFEDTLENNDLSLLPESVTENEATRKLIMECIDKLPDEQRVCVVMFYYDELSVKEIAEALDIPVGTVKSRLNKARKTLKAAFEEIEKKDKIKLHGIPFAPLLTWAFREGAQAERLPKFAFHHIIRAILEALKGSGKIAAGAKFAGSAAMAKLIAGALAGVVAVTGIGFGVNALLNKGKEEDVTQPVAAVTEATTEPETVSEPYYAEGSLAVKDRNGTVYYISDKGIMKKLPDGDKLISSKVPENLVYTDALLYLHKGTLYSFDGEKEEEVMPADGAALYETKQGFISIAADGRAAYAIDTNQKSCQKLRLSGERMQFIDGNLYYYDGSDNLCKSTPVGEGKSTVISTKDTKGFRAGWSVARGKVYYAGFNSDADGTIYAASPSLGTTEKIKLSSDGIRDFTVIGNSIYYCTYKGKFYRCNPDGTGSTLIAEKNMHHLCDSDGCTVWAEMGSDKVYIVQEGAATLQSAALPNTVIDLNKMGNTVYYRTGSDRSSYSLGSDGSE